MANAFRSRLLRRLRDDGAPNGEPLQSMYRVDGDPYLTEEVLDHMEGWRGSVPVRSGNGAADQLQMDICGEAIYALARAGRLHQARYSFDEMLTYANHVGLFAEEVGLRGEQLGNFPRAFTHLALITAALALDTELDQTASAA